MSEDPLRAALGSVRAEDVRLDPLGRVIITSPSVAEAVRGATEVKPDELAAAARRDDTNIICCGNTRCPSRGTDLGSIVERFTPGSGPPR